MDTETVFAVKSTLNVPVPENLLSCAEGVTEGCRAALTVPLHRALPEAGIAVGSVLGPMALSVVSTCPALVSSTAMTKAASFSTTTAKTFGCPPEIGSKTESPSPSNKLYCWPWLSNVSKVALVKLICMGFFVTIA